MSGISTVLDRLTARRPNVRVLVMVGALLAGGVASTPAGAAPATAFVRVNQLGYATGSQAKRAYLMASASEAGASFSIEDASGVTVYSAPIGTNLGKWSTSYPDVY